MGLETGSEFLNAVTVATGGGVWGDGQQPANLLKRMLVPDLEDDDFALFNGQRR